MARLEVNVNDETALALRRLAAEKDVSVTEIIRLAVSMHYFLTQQVKEGKQIQTVTKHGKIHNVKLP